MTPSAASRRFRRVAILSILGPVAVVTVSGCGATMRTVTTTTTAPATKPASTATSSTAPASKPEEFSGDGGKNFGTIKVDVESTLTWTNDGGFFAIYTSQAVPVYSMGHSGTTVLSPGTYSDFHIIAIGNWTIKIEPK